MSQRAELHQILSLLGPGVENISHTFPRKSYHVSKVCAVIASAEWAAYCQSIDH